MISHTISWELGSFILPRQVVRPTCNKSVLWNIGEFLFFLYFKAHKKMDSRELTVQNKQSSIGEVPVSWTCWSQEPADRLP